MKCLCIFREILGFSYKMSMYILGNPRIILWNGSVGSHKSCQENVSRIQKFLIWVEDLQFFVLSMENVGEDGRGAVFWGVRLSGEIWYAYQYVCFALCTLI